ncbi:MAG: chemotaxis protein CheA, partial [Planctomycetota bacterium]|nr:chemotaxis protein CheA [Planctomycetota bacterium]
DSPPCETAAAQTKSKERAVKLKPADAKPAPSAATSPAGKTPPRTQANKPRAAAVVGETLRVDLDRLDQLMNLGGELVINRARFVQIHRQLGQLFTGGNVGYLVDDIAERINRLNQDIAGLSRTGDDRKIVKDLADTSHLLTHDFVAVRDIVHQVHESRSTMNDFSEALHSLNRVSEGIQKRIMETRMVSIGPLFQRFRRVIRDMSKSTGKEVELLLSGETTELDKRMIDELGDPLTHMVRNSVDHGIELPEERVKAGKPRLAKITLNAYHRGRYICIEVRDDGKGVNVEAVKAKILEKNLATPAQLEQMSEKEIIQYVFKPGFSTAKRVTDLSGRGMGMDIVINKLENFNGTVEIESESGKGAVVTIRLPLTLAIITSLLTRIGKGVYAVPLEMVAEIISVSRESVRYIQKRRAIQVRDRTIPVVLLEQVFDTDRADLQTRSRDDDSYTLVILGFQDEKIGLVVDEMIGQEDIVIKNLATNFRNVNGIAGASIMGDGTVSLILDVSSMMTMLAERSDCKAPQSEGQDAPEQPRPQEPVSCGEESDADNTLCAAVEAS